VSHHVAKPGHASAPGGARTTPHSVESNGTRPRGCRTRVQPTTCSAEALAWRRSCNARWHEQTQRQPESLQGGRPRAAGRRDPPGAQQAEARAERRSGAVRDAPVGSRRDLAGRPVCISERAVRRERAAGERFEWRDAPRAWQRRVESPCYSANAQAGRHSPLAERRVYRDEAIRIQHEDARHEHELTIEDCREKAVSGHHQEVCRIRWKEGVQRRSEEILGFPTEVIRRREEARRSGGITETHNEKSLNRGSRVGAAAGRIDLLAVGEVDWRTLLGPRARARATSQCLHPKGSSS